MYKENVIKSKVVNLRMRKNEEKSRSKQIENYNNPNKPVLFEGSFF